LVLTRAKKKLSKSKKSCKLFIAMDGVAFFLIIVLITVTSDNRDVSPLEKFARFFTFAQFFLRSC
jgi:hypothetical protein